MRVGSNFARSGLIANRVDLAVKLYPGIVAAPIVLGGDQDKCRPQ